MPRYERIEIPPIRPVVTQVERYGCHCPQCGKVQVVAVPDGLAPGSPFGDSVAALVTTLGYSHAIRYGRVTQVMRDVFGLALSQGAIAHLLVWVKEQLSQSVNGIVTRLWQARVNCCRLNRPLEEVLALCPIQADGIRLQKRYRNQ